MRNARGLTILHGIAIVVAVMSGGICSIASGQDDSARAGKLGVAREAAAQAFAKKHAPELLEFVLRMKDKYPHEYERTMKEIFEASEHLQAVKEDDPDMYRLAVNGWRLEKKIHVLAAKMVWGDENQDQKALEEELAKVCGALVKIQVEHTNLAIDRMKAELAKLREERDHLIDNKDAVARDHLNKLKIEIKRQKAAAGTGGDTGLAHELQDSDKIPEELRENLKFLKHLIQRRQQQGRDLSKIAPLVNELNDSLRARDFETAQELTDKILEILDGGKAGEKRFSPTRY